MEKGCLTGAVLIEQGITAGRESGKKHPASDLLVLPMGRGQPESEGKGACR